MNGIVGLGLGGSATSAIIGEHSLAISTAEDSHFCINGIVALGLGGHAQGLVISEHSTGYCHIEVDVTPVEPKKPSSGGYFTWPITRRHKKLYDDIAITIRRDDQVWTRLIRVERHGTPVIIRIVGVINRITTNVTAQIKAMRSVLSKIRIK